MISPRHIAALIAVLLANPLQPTQSQTRKAVQECTALLASHSHYYMKDIYNTPHWKGMVLPGWIVGTAGARRNPLPKKRDGAAKSLTNV
jgi:hypothetical protein